MSDGGVQGAGPMSWDNAAMWFLVILLLLAWGVDLIRVWRVTNDHDLKVIVGAARRLARGENIYAHAAPFKAAIEEGTFDMQDDSVVWPYAYPPFLAMLFVPLASLPLQVLSGLWWSFNVVALLAGSWFCLRVMGPVTPPCIVVVLLMLYRFYPAVATLRLGQIELVQFLLLSATLHALDRGRECLAGGALGLAAGLKFFPGALAGLLLWRRRWRAAVVTVLVALVTALGSFALVGFDTLGDYMRYSAMYGVGGAFAAFPFNQSLNGFFSRNLMRNAFTTPLKGLHLPWLAKGLTLFCDAVVVAVSAWLTWHRRPWPQEPEREQRRGFSLEFALGVVALLLVSPHSQVYTLVWSLIPLILLSARFLEGGKPVWWQGGGLIVVYALLGRDYMLYYPGLTRFVESHYLFGLLLLWGICALALFRERGGKTWRALPSFLDL